MVLITLICVLTGLGFAALATWLSTTRGNTISDILKSNKLENSEAIRVEIAKVVNVSASVPIVAMYVVAFASAFGLPGFIYWRTLSDSRPIHLFGSFADSEENRLRQGDVRLVPVGNYNDAAGNFQVPLLNSAEKQSFIVEGGDINPLTIYVTLHVPENSAHVEIATVRNVDLKLDPTSGSITLDGPPIHLTHARDAAGPPVANVAAAEPLVGREYANVPPPPQK